MWKFLGYALLGVMATVVVKAAVPPSLADNFNAHLRAGSYLAQPVAATEINKEEIESESTQKPYLAQHTNVRDYLVIRSMMLTIFYAEGTYPNATCSEREIKTQFPGGRYDPYRVGFDCKVVAQSWNDHPRIRVPFRNGLGSSPIGVCQIMPDTFDKVWRNYGSLLRKDIPKLHPLNQDRMCLILFFARDGEVVLRGVSLTEDGRIKVDRQFFERSIINVHCEWASLPDVNDRSCYQSAKYGSQEAVPMEKLWQIFNKYLDEQQQLVPGIQPGLAAKPETRFVEELKATPQTGNSVQGYRVSSIRGVRPIHPVTGQRNVWHRGFDLATPVGVPLRVPTAGTVECRNQPGKAGIYAIYSTSTFPGRYWVLMHLSSCNPGRYALGQQFAATGNTGGSTRPHLHLEMWVWLDNYWQHTDFAKGWFSAFLNGKMPFISG